MISVHYNKLFIDDMLFKKIASTFSKKQQPTQDGLRWFVDAPLQEQKKIIAASAKGAIELQKKLIKTHQQI